MGEVLTHALTLAVRVEPALLRAGDRVKFRAITPEEFSKQEERP